MPARKSKAKKLKLLYQKRFLAYKSNKNALNNIGHEGTNVLMNFSRRENWSKVAALEKMYNNAIKRR